MGTESIEGVFRASKMKVQLLVNEAAVPIPACGEKTDCSVQRFLCYYSHIKENCDIMQKNCGIHRRCKKTSKGMPRISIFCFILTLHFIIIAWVLILVAPQEMMMIDDILTSKTSHFICHLLFLIGFLTKYIRNNHAKFHSIIEKRLSKE